MISFLLSYRSVLAKTYMDTLKSLQDSRRRAAQITWLRIGQYEAEKQRLQRKMPYNYLEQIRIINENLAIFNGLYETQKRAN